MATTKALATTKRAAPKAAPAVIEEGEYVISGVPTLAQVKEVLESGSKFYLDDTSSDTGSFLASTLGRADTPEGLFAESELLSTKDHLGEVFIIEGIDAVRPSDYDEPGGLGVYLVVSAIDSDGELVKLSVGSKDAFAKIIALSEMGSLPWRVSFEKAEKATKRGFFPINLVNRQAATKSGKKVDF